MVGRKPRSESPHREAAKALAAGIRARRQELGWSQQRLAEEAAVSYGTVRAIETNSVVEPGVFTVQLIARALGLGLWDLVNEEHTRRPTARTLTTSRRLPRSSSSRTS